METVSKRTISFSDMCHTYKNLSRQRTFPVGKGSSGTPQNICIMEAREYLKEEIKPIQATISPVAEDISVACSYCKEPEQKCLVKCLETGCGRWFCNSAAIGKSVKLRQSHIITHLRSSHHRTTQYVPPSATQKGKTTSSPLQKLLKCTVCDNSNLFDLGMYNSGDPHDPKNRYCREHWRKMELTHVTWAPLVTCANEFTCIDNRLVKNYSSTFRAERAVSAQQIQTLERQWMLQQFQSQVPYLAPGAPLKLNFNSLPEYKDVFNKLVTLSSKLESLRVGLIPPLENISIKEHNNGSILTWLKFEIKSNVHANEFSKGAVLELEPMDNISETTFQGMISENRVLQSGTTIKVSFRENKKIPVCLMRNKWKITWIHVDVNGQRFKGAIKNFGSRCSKIIVRQIVGLPSIKQPALDSLLSNVGISERMQMLSVNGKRGLNASQLKAVHMALTSSVSLIQGPPGTGKTHTMTEIVDRFLSGDRSAKILCCAASNDATDHMALKCDELKKYDVVRLQSKSNEGSTFSSVRHLTIASKIGRHAEELSAEAYFQLEKDTIKNARIICVTCSTAASSLLDGMQFRLVIIDEATQATEPEVLITINRGCEKLVLIGDQKQLGVTVTDAELENTNWGQSMFERLIKQKSVASVMLDHQYRMHPTIANPPSVIIYDGLLKTGEGVKELRKCNLLRFLQTNEEYSPNLFINTQHLHELASNAVSILNGGEAFVVAQILAKLLYKGISVQDVGVITFYNGQKEELKKSIDHHECIQNFYKAANQKVMVDSVDAFQGKEKNYIILSCVRSGTYGMGFLSDRRRLNVALTRAKKGVIIVGNKQLLQSNATWKKFLQYYKHLNELNALKNLGCIPGTLKRCQFCIAARRF